MLRTNCPASEHGHVRKREENLEGIREKQKRNQQALTGIYESKYLL